MSDRLLGLFVVGGFAMVVAAIIIGLKLAGL